MIKVIQPDPIITDTTVGDKIYVDIDLSILRNYGIDYVTPDPNYNWNFVGFMFNDKFINGLPYLQKEFAYQRNEVLFNDVPIPKESVSDSLVPSTFFLVNQDYIELDPSMQIVGRELNVDATVIGLPLPVTEMSGIVTTKYTGITYPNYKLVARYWTNTPIDSTIDLLTDMTTSVKVENSFTIDNFGNYLYVIYHTKGTDITSADTDTLVINGLSSIEDGSAVFNLDHSNIEFSTDCTVAVYIDSTLTDTTILPSNTPCVIEFQDEYFTKFDVTVSDPVLGYNRVKVCLRDYLLFIDTDLPLTLVSCIDSPKAFNKTIFSTLENLRILDELCETAINSFYYIQSANIWDRECLSLDDGTAIQYVDITTTEPATAVFFEINTSSNNILLIDTTVQAVHFAFEQSGPPKPIYNHSTKTYYAPEDTTNLMYNYVVLDPGEYKLEIPHNWPGGGFDHTVAVGYNGPPGHFDATDCTGTYMGVGEVWVAYMDATNCVGESIFYVDSTISTVYFMKFIAPETKTYIFTQSSCPWYEYADAENPLDSLMNIYDMAWDTTLPIGNSDDGHDYTDPVTDRWYGNSRCTHVPMKAGTEYLIELNNYNETDVGPIMVECMEHFPTQPIEYLEGNNRPQYDYNGQPYLRKVCYHAYDNWMIYPQWTNDRPDTTGLPVAKFDFTCLETEIHSIGIWYMDMYDVYTEEYVRVDDNPRMGVADATIHLFVYDSSDTEIYTYGPLGVAHIDGTQFYSQPEAFGIDLTAGEVYRLEFVNMDTTSYYRLSRVDIHLRDLYYSAFQINPFSIPGDAQGEQQLEMWSYHFDSSGDPFTSVYTFNAWDTTDADRRSFYVDDTSLGNGFDWELTIRDFADNTTILADSTGLNEEVFIDLTGGQKIIIEVHRRSDEVDSTKNIN